MCGVTQQQTQCRSPIAVIRGPTVGGLGAINRGGGGAASVTMCRRVLRCWISRPGLALRSMLDHLIAARRGELP